MFFKDALRKPLDAACVRDPARHSRSHMTAKTSEKYVIPARFCILCFKTYYILKKAVLYLESVFYTALSVLLQLGLGGLSITSTH